jgi:hypothetical protein
MKDILIEIEPLYATALDIVAKSNSLSRRQYISDYLRKGVDKVPGLLDLARKIHGNIIDMDGEGMSLSSDDSSLLRDKKEDKIVERRERWRFYYHDESLGFIEGIGSAAGTALIACTGKKWTNEEYIQVFQVPQFIENVSEGE